MPTTIRLPRYILPGKSRTYSILAYPPQANLWAYDVYPEDDQLMIDGDRAAFRQLAHALAILLADPMQIVYFPTAHPKPERRYHAVLLHPNLQFRRSEWFDLKPRLNRRHYAGAYEFSNNPQKLLAEYEPLRRRMEREYHDYDRRIKRSYAEQMIGDTIFLVLPRELCYRAHARILCALEDSEEELYSCAMPTDIGYLLSERTIGEIYEKE